jgi:Tol biopolymer transport system component
MATNPNKLSRFWKELKRRKVIQVIVFYATAAFVIIELVNNVTEPLKLPEWTPTFTIIFLIIGFPVALIFSWIFDLTPGGVARTESSGEVKEYENESSIPVTTGNLRWGRIINWSLVSLLLVVTATYLIVRKINTPDLKQVERYTLRPPEGEHFRNEETGSVVTISPDGTNIVFVSYIGDTSYLFLKRLDAFEALRLPGSESAEGPFFAPDNTWVGFFADGVLKKVSLHGGQPQTICEAKSGKQGCWGLDDTIIFADSYKSCLMSVSSNGGIPVQLTKAQNLSNDEMVWSHTSPHILPGGHELLFTKGGGPGTRRIATYSLRTGQTRDLFINGNSARYVRTGHLVYAWERDLYAVPFDLNSLKVKGEPVMILKGVLMSRYDIASYSISEEGSIVYVPGGNVLDLDDNLVLVDRKGAYESLGIHAGKSPKFSPDGSEVIYALWDNDTYNMWIYGIERGTNGRFSEKEYRAGWAIWSPDGSQIIYNSNMHGGEAVTLYSKKSDGTGQPKRLTVCNYHQQPQCWSRDGNLLIYTEGIHPETGMDIFMLQMEGDSVPVPLFNSQFNETHPIISPDGHRLAYVSDETGREEVFVCTFPDLGEVKQISTEGGREPLWAPDGKEIYYRDITGNKLMSVTILDDESFGISLPELVFEGRFQVGGGAWGRDYDISPDGERLIMILREETIPEVSQINIVRNWTEELVRMVSAGK